MIKPSCPKSRLRISLSCPRAPAPENMTWPRMQYLQTWIWRGSILVLQ